MCVTDAGLTDAESLRCWCRQSDGGGLPVLTRSIGACMSFALYLLGFLVLIAGIGWGLGLAGVPQLYIMVACVILLGLGIATGATRTRAKDPPA